METNIQVNTNADCDAISNNDVTNAATDNLLEVICKNSNLPTFSNSASRLAQLSSSSKGSIHELTQFILADVSLTQKILSLSNSVSFRSTSGQEITSISKAILVLGLNTVKTCALAIILVENMPSKQAQCVRKELMLALTASVIGRELAKRIHFKDPEEVTIAALFKNVGRLLVAAYDHELYDDIMAMVEMDIQTPEKASELKLGYSFDTITEIALQKWKIPNSIIQAVKHLSHKTLTPPKTRQEWMQQVAVFSEEVAPMIILPASQEEKEQENEVLIARFGKSLHLDESSLEELFINSEKNSQALARSANLNIKASTSNSVNTNSNVSRQGNQTIESFPSGKPFNTLKLLETGIQGIEKATSGGIKNKDLLELFVKTIFHSFCFRFATICIKDAETHQFQGCCSLGENHTKRQEGFYFSITSSQDLFQLTLREGVDLFISNASDTKIKNLIPAWHRTLLPDARSFIILPLIKNKKPIGLLYADRILEAPEGISPKEKTLIKYIKEQVITVIHY